MLSLAPSIRFHPHRSRSYLTQIYCVVNVDRRHIKIYTYSWNDERLNENGQNKAKQTLFASSLTYTYTLMTERWNERRNNTLTNTKSNECT